MPSRIFYILCIILLITSSCNSNSRSAKEEYELQERCKQSGDAWFKENTPKEGESTSTFYHQNHYNKKLNKCFVLFTAIVPSWDANNKRGPTGKRTLLMDVNESNSLGEFWQSNIDADKKSWEYKHGSGDMIDIESSKQINCNNKDDWDKLVKPYMEK